MAVSSADDLRCPRCRNTDRLHMANSHPEKFPAPPPAAPGTPAVPLGAVMVVYLLASLQFLAGNLYGQLTDWPPALSILGNLLPKPLLSAALAALVLLVALDRATRELLLRGGRAALLHYRFHQEPDARTSTIALAAVPVGLAGFGWGVFLGLRSLDSWLGMSTAWASAGPGWVLPVVQGFLAGGLSALVGLPLSAFIMAWTVRVSAEYGVPRGEEGSPGDFARNLVYPCSLFPLMMGLAVGSGLPVLFVLATCWFLAAMIVAALRTLEESTEMALPAALLAAVPVTLAFFFVLLQVKTNVVNSDWGALRGKPQTAPDLESLWLVSALALAALLGLIAYLPVAWARRRGVGSSRASQQATALWKKVLYCERCDGVHLPNQPGFVPASEMAGLLRGSERKERPL